MNSKELPNLLIPGSQKAGTSSLYMFLKEHPQVQGSTPKEPYFFCKEFSAKELEEYKNCFSQNNAQKKNPKIRFEASTPYLNSPLAAKRIKKTLGKEIKFIILLRDPARRAISAYYHNAKREADCRSIEEALALKAIQTKRSWNPQEIKNLEMQNLNAQKSKINGSLVWPIGDDPLLHFYYLHNSFYSVHIQRYLKEFPKENILFIQSEMFRDSPAKILKKIEEFLEIDTKYLPKNINETFNQTNYSSQGIVGKLQKQLRKIVSQMKIRSTFLEKVYQQFQKRHGTQKKQNTNSTIEEMYQNLKPLFKQEVKELEKITGLELQANWRY